MIGKVPSTFTIQAENKDQRIDNFLFTRLKKMPKSHVYKMLRKGIIRVNKKRTKPDYHLQVDDVIRLPYIEPTIQQKPLRSPSIKIAQALLKNILYEDKNLLILNKPSGLAVHGGSGINFGVIEIMRSICPENKNLELVHRLDRDTSGCLMLAKNRQILKELHTLLQNGQIIKKYSVLVRGKWQDGTREVKEALRKNQLQSGERMVKVDAEGKHAMTIFRPKKTSNLASLLEAELKTGRTHQIRVHAAYIGYPVAGDEKYGDKKFNAAMRNKGLKRLFLHAISLNFRLPSTQQIIKITAPLPADLQTTLTAI